MPHNLKLPLSLTILILVATPHLGRAQTAGCSKPGIERAVREVADSRKTLLELPLGIVGADAGEVSPAGAEAITQMKDHLNNLVAAYMVCLPVQNEADPKRIVQDLSQLTHAYQLPHILHYDSLPPDSDKYGFELWFEARATRDARRLISITAAFEVQCSTDTVLLIFSPSREAWRELLRWQSEPYKEVGGAFDAFQYRISPPDETGKWFVATAYIPGWCSSTWSMINYSVLRPVAGSPRPKVILAKSDSIWWGGDDLGTLVTNRSNFDLRFHAQSIDLGVHNRVFIRRYTVDGDVVRRVPPVAVSPRDFVDEWIVTPWPEAKAWSAATNLENLRLMHEKLYKMRDDPDSGGFVYRAVRRCTDSPGAFQISFCPKEPGPYYLRVQTRPSLTMITVKETSDPACTGRNLLDDMATRDSSKLWSDTHAEDRSKPKQNDDCCCVP